MNKKLLSITFCILFIVSCGGGGGGGGSTPTTPTLAATVNLSAEPTSVLLESTSTLTWSTSNATSCSASGAWSGTKATSGSEAVTISNAGDNSFTLSCTGAGGSGSASVTVEGYRNTDGVVVDGYISGAEVFIDEDDDWVADSNESSTTSDNDGKFTIKYANGNLVSIGGTDLDSQTFLDNLLITHKLSGHTDFKAVTPVTSIAAFMADSSSVNEALGIDASIDVFTFDPVANKGDGGINDYLYEKGNQLTVLAYTLQNITNNLNTTTETTQDYFKAITEEIEKEYTETETRVDIETKAFVTKVFDNIVAAKSVTIDETAKSNSITALAGVMPVIEVKSEDDLTTAVIRFSISTLQTDIQTIANGSASAVTVTNYTEDILNYIATDQNVDASKIAPDIKAIADSATTQEDTDVVINILVNDSYVKTSPFSLSINNPSNGTIATNNNIVTYTPDADYNGSDTFTYSLTQGDKTATAEVSITIESVNDEPSIDIASTVQADENQVSVTTVSVSDVDGDDLTLTLGGTDADSFNLSSENILTFKEAPDYETKSTYTVTLSLTDGTITVTKDITILINNLNDNAPIISSVDFSVEENQLSIGAISASDSDNDALIFSLDASAPTSNCSSNVCISLDSNSGLLSFGIEDAIAPDYETITSYTFNVKVSDGIYSAIKSITVNILNVNDVFPVIDTDEFSPEENQKSIGQIIASDIEGDTLTYSIVGTDADLLTLSDSTLTFKTYPDFESKNLYSITIEVFDGLNTTSKDIDINIQDIWSEYAFNGGRYYAPQTTYSLADPITGQSYTYNFDADWYCSDDDYLYCPTIELSLKEMNKPYHPYSDSITGNYYSTPMSRIGNTNEINWTLSFWIRPDVLDCLERYCKGSSPYVPDRSAEIIRGINNVAYVAGQGPGQEDLEFWMYRGPNNELYFEIKDKLALRNNQAEYESDFRYQVSTKNNVLTLHNWSHVLLRCNVPSLVANTECEFFVNGESAIDIAKHGNNYRGSSVTTGNAFNDARELKWEAISVNGTHQMLDDITLWSGLASDTQVTSIYNAGIPKNMKDFTIQNNKPSMYYRFEKEHLGIYEWINGPLIGGGTIANAAYDIDTDLDRNNLDLITEYVDLQKNIIRDVPTNKSPETISVTVAENSYGDGNVYVIDGEQKKSITLELGKTYIFNYPEAHPLKFSETANGTHDGGEEYIRGINTTSNGITIITPSIDTPQTLYYYCSVHSGMGGSASIN